MDDFRNNKYDRRRNGSIDGFLSGSGARKQSPRSLTSANLGNFRKKDGFHASAPSKLATTGRQPNRDPSGQIRLNMPPASPPKRHKHRKWPRRILKTTATLFVLVIFIWGALFGRGLLKARQIFKGGGGAAALQENVDPAKLRGEGDGRINILLLGKGGLGHEGADLTDTIIIASIDPTGKEAALFSIPRDFYVRSNGSLSKINAVYPNAKYRVLAETSSKDPDRDKKAEEAGLKAIDDVVASTMGIPIHYHVMIDFTGFKDAINTVGGVDVNVPEAESVYERMTIDNKQYTLDVKAGQQHFDGFRALAFSRSRHTSPRGDFDRAERQRLILVALKGKVFSAGTYGNPFKINQLITNFGDHVQANMTTDELTRLYKIGNDIGGDKIKSLSLVDPPNVLIKSSTNERHESIQIPKAGLENYKDIQSFVRNQLRDGFLNSENATVTILNGTNVSGLATRTGDELKSYGYTIGQIADAPSKGYGQTIIVDVHGNKPYTAHYLENRFSVKAVKTLPDQAIVPGNADFVIILGQNEVSRLDSE